MCIRDSLDVMSIDEISKLFEKFKVAEKKGESGDDEADEAEAVSYTHLDVYKRQRPGGAMGGADAVPASGRVGPGTRSTHLRTILWRGAGG